jgi:hypothetical protein
MKSIKYLIGLAVLIMVVVYLNNNDKQLVDAPPKPTKPVNQVTLQSSQSDSAIEQQSQAEKHIEKTAVEQLPEDSIVLEIDDKTDDEPELDYVTAYRDWQYFANCYTDVEDFHNGTDPLETLAGRFANNPRESQAEPTPQQISFYQDHVEICQSMIEDENDDFYEINRQLQQRFEKIAPKTEIEKQLEHALQMVQQLKKFKNEYSRAQFSTSNLPPRELKNINSQIEELTATMLEIYDGSETLTPQQAQLVKQYGEEIESLRLRIITSKIVDDKKLTGINSKIDGYLNSMDDYLHRVQSADAFLIIGKELYTPEYLQKDSTVIKTLKQQTGILDSYYINILNAIAIPLIACSMDYPCDAKSDLMLSYCLGLKDSMFNQACGRSLEDFYFSFYIGANQLNDVNLYFNYLVNRYAN